MVLAQSAFTATFGLVIIFGVLFPALAQGLIAFAAYVAVGEKAENDAYAEGRTDGAGDRR